MEKCDSKWKQEVEELEAENGVLLNKVEALQEVSEKLVNETASKLMAPSGL